MIDFLAPPRAGLFFAFSTSKKPPQNVMANLVFIANFADLCDCPLFVLKSTVVSGLVTDEGDIRVACQECGGGAGGHHTGEHLHDGIVLGSTAGHDDDLAGVQNGAHAHRECLLGHIVLGGEEAGVGLDGGGGQVGEVSGRIELITGLVEADVTVLTDTQNLQVNAAQRGNQRLVASALGSAVLGQTVGNIGVCLVDVDMVKQMVVHEIAIALIVIGGDGVVFIQIDGADSGEIQLAGLILLDQAGIHTLGGGAGGKTQHAVGLERDLRRDDIGSLGGHFRIILADNNLHVLSFLSLFGENPLFIVYIVT